MYVLCFVCLARDATAAPAVRLRGRCAVRYIREMRLKRRVSNVFFLFRDGLVINQGLLVKLAVSGTGAAQNDSVLSGSGDGVGGRRRRRGWP